MIYLVGIAAWFLLGLVVGRWLAALAGVAFAVWIGATTGVDEVPHWLLALIYGVLTVSGIILGVAVRRAFRSGVA